MAEIDTEIKQREPALAETEQRITELEQQSEKGRLIDERIKKLIPNEYKKMITSVSYTHLNSIKYNCFIVYQKELI